MECDPIALTCKVFNCVDNNRFAILTQKPFLGQGPKPKGLDNLRETIRRSRENKWRACEIYRWLEEHIPDHQYLGLAGKVNDLDGRSDVLIQFKSLDHMVLFKLTWGGV